MHYFKKIVYSLFIFGLALLSVRCKNKPAPEVIVPEPMDVQAGKLIEEYLSTAIANEGKIDDILLLNQDSITYFLYKSTAFTTHWSDRDSILPVADTLIDFIRNSRYFGLFPDNYKSNFLDTANARITRDTAAISYRKDVSLWAKFDLVLTDAFVQVIKDVKLGRLPNDSISLRKDTIISDSFFLNQFNNITKGKVVFSALVSSLEPHISAYHKLKKALVKFADTADFTSQYTTLPYLSKDTALFAEKLAQRLKEENIDADLSIGDSVSVAMGIIALQNKYGLKADGKMGMQTAAKLNTSDNYRFIQAAIALDKYKLLPDTMPEKYIWVNIPSYYMKLVENDKELITSKIVVGKPITRTPELNSVVYEMITYPQWTIPASIIKKEILPALKKNPGYLIRKGYSLIDRNSEEVDPYSVDWTKYTNGIPYRVVQGSGDANALGIMKFNFRNKYSVYLHDTNQRFYFSRSDRALSHGCVRVQDWKTLALYMLDNDSTNMINSGKYNFTPVDSVLHWLSEKEKHIVPLKNKIPVYIRYFTCEGKDDRIVFYPDIYNEDDKLMGFYSIAK